MSHLTPASPSAHHPHQGRTMLNHAMQGVRQLINHNKHPHNTADANPFGKALDTPDDIVDELTRNAIKLNPLIKRRIIKGFEGIPSTLQLGWAQLENLKLLAPEKDHKSVYQPMRYIQQGVLTNKEDRKKFRHVPRFVPAGQSTQMIVGATTESDKDILYLSSSLYQHPTMRRVYYSGYISVNTYDKRLPALKQPPLVRENRLYQADWLLRFYQFKVEEIVDDSYPDLDLEIDPKLGWALRHPELFPIDINQADYEMILRVPGIGIKSARQIIASRRFSKLGFYELKKIGVVMKKAQYFITCNELPTRTVNELTPTGVRRLLVPKPKKKVDERQLILNFTDNE